MTMAYELPKSKVDEFIAQATAAFVADVMAGSHGGSAVIRLPDGCLSRRISMDPFYLRFLDASLDALAALTFAEDTDRPGFREVIDHLRWDEMR
ncbi:hypothetical protein HL667_33635 [Bradyrhizobium sp. 83012]|uniref:Prevent-host-death protein n=1 Tax=Bradyrhizobium aeschynomenes TaxID=2734909 RepID=A0ABX2CP44_9BRAD|nr:hypothetical protein [Bradyrhizobium aeschynomenes]NPU69974.1 hypothetical protein [Bradyrhizobium aeschynomenes]